MSTMVPYHRASVLAAREMTQKDKSAIERYRTITEYIDDHFRYDYIRAATVPKKNGVPDIPRTWEKRAGICLDLASLATGMLRGVGVNAWMCTGKADKQSHAWVEALIGGKRVRYDYGGKKAKNYKTERIF